MQKPFIFCCSHIVNYLMGSLNMLGEPLFFFKILKTSWTLSKYIP